MANDHKTAVFFFSSVFILVLIEKLRGTSIILHTQVNLLATRSEAQLVKTQRHKRFCWLHYKKCRMTWLILETKSFDHSFIVYLNMSLSSLPTLCKYWMTPLFKNVQYIQLKDTRCKHKTNYSSQIIPNSPNVLHLSATFFFFFKSGQ